jgi:hypothetical protein
MVSRRHGSSVLNSSGTHARVPSPLMYREGRGGECGVPAPYSPPSQWKRDLAPGGYKNVLLKPSALVSNCFCFSFSNVMSYSINLLISDSM